MSRRTAPARARRSQGVISGHQPPGGKHSNVIGGSISSRDIADGSITGADLAPSALPKAKTKPPLK